MKTIAAAKFKEQCLAILDDIDAEGIVITKRGKPVARLVRFPDRKDHAHLIGILRGELVLNDLDDLHSTDAWASEEWEDVRRAEP